MNKTQRIEELLKQYQVSKDWDVFTELWTEIEDEIDKMASYHFKYANRRLVDIDDVKSQLKVLLVQIIDKYNQNHQASGKVYKTCTGNTNTPSFYRYVRYNLGCYIQDLVKWTNAKKVEKNIENEDGTDGIENVSDKRGNVFGILEKLYADLSETSKQIFDQYLRSDLKKVARLYKVKWLTTEEKKMKARVDTLVAEAVELSYAKNLNYF